MKLIDKIGCNVVINNNEIEISGNYKSLIKIVEVESDWSSASYFYSIVALSRDAEITLKIFKKDSIQGDSIVSKIYQKLGVETIYKEDSITRATTDFNFNKIFNDGPEVSLNGSPTVSPVIAALCASEPL